MKQQCLPVVLWRGEAEGIRDEPHQAWDAVMSRKGTADSEHSVDDEQIALSQRGPRNDALNAEVQHRNHQDTEHDVDRHRDGGEVRRVPNHLHVGNPVTICNDEERADKHGTFRNSVSCPRDGMLHFFRDDFGIVSCLLRRGCRIRAIQFCHF